MPACAGIFNDWIDATPWMPRVHEHEDVTRYYWDHVFAHHTLTVAETTSQKIAGYIGTDKETMVTALYLAPDSRGQGLGHILLDCAKRSHPERLELWTFVANAGAQRFYRREGFSEVRRTDGDNEEHLPDVLFRWPAPEERH